MALLLALDAIFVSSKSLNNLGRRHYGKYLCELWVIGLGGGSVSYIQLTKANHYTGSSYLNRAKISSIVNNKTNRYLCLCFLYFCLIHEQSFNYNHNSTFICNTCIYQISTTFKI